VLTSSKRIAAYLVVSSSLSGFPRAALADVAACVKAHASGQREEKAGRLKAASELFASCVSENGCPDAIRSECAEFYEASKHNLPTLIFAVLDEQGADLIQVRVFAEEQLLTESLDGRPIAVDPGRHHFKFELATGQILESDVLVHEGEKNRIVRVREKPGPNEPTQPATASSGDSGGQRVLPPSFWIASSVSAAAFGSFGAFALLGHGKQSTLDACSPSCSSSQRADFEAMRRDYLVADISLGVAVASAGVATWLFFRSDGSGRAEQHAATSPWSRVRVTPLVSPRGAGLVLDASAF